MKALTIEPGRPGSLQLDEVPDPPAEQGAVLAKTKLIGICGTDIELASGLYGWAPPGRQRLVIGHESLATVVEAPDGCGLERGDLLVGIVRRPDPVPCPSCAVGEWDMCRNDRYTERGIKELDGYCSEYFRIEPAFAIKLDPQLHSCGVLLEPASVVAKAWDHIDRIGRRTHWMPQRVLITGAGPVGLLAALLGVQRELEVHVLDRVKEGIKPALVRDLGAEYHCDGLGKLGFRPDIVVECTGVPALIVDAINTTASGSIVCLAGVSSQGYRIPLDVGLLNRTLVLENDVIFGSVNANHLHYETAAAALAKADPAWLERLLTRRVPLARWKEAFDRREGDVKTVIEFRSRPMPEKIEDYALIGDCETAALVGKSGSIDWLCLPRFDSDACFTALLGTPEHGRWLLAPMEPAKVQRRYQGDTLVLRTEFETASGTVAVIDFMPIRDNYPHVVRIVEGVRGNVTMRMELVLRFEYGRSVPWVTKLDEGGGLRAVAGPHMVVLRSPVPVHGEGRRSLAEFSIAQGDRLSFSLSYAPSHLELPAPLDTDKALAQTGQFWKDWSAKSQYQGEWRSQVQRSLITLKALTYDPTGGIVAAPTTSLPERLGGTRNWDYRFCWLRDATLTLLALMNAGYHEEAAAWRRWLLRSVAGSADQVQIMYGLAGERHLTEWEADWLPGYLGAKPVRIGNAAAGQLQLDVYGEVVDALHQARLAGLERDIATIDMQRVMLQRLEQIWQEPDEGIWEVRGGRQHFTYSKVMAWVAFDRAVQRLEKHHAEGPFARWREIRQRIHDDVCAKAYDSTRGSFMQAYGSKALDASLLLIPSTGFLPPTDPRVKGTLAAVERELLVKDFVIRYSTFETEDGLPPREGAFLACSFWLADSYILQGRIDEARRLFERLLGLCNDVGLLAEEYDVDQRCQVGNFPQAFSHIALINTAFNLGRASGPARQRAGTATGAGPGASAARG